MGTLGDKIMGIGVQFLAKGTETFFDSLEGQGRASLKPVVAEFPELPDDVPEAIRALQKQTLEAPGAWFTIPLIIMAVASIIGGTIGFTNSTAKAGQNTFERWFKSTRFGPGEIVSLWLRSFPDPAEADRWFEDLKDQGFDDRRVDAIKELAHIIPPLADMTRFADFSAFDEEVIAAWREFYDAPDWIKGPFSLLGVTGEWADKYWFSHWIQPGRYELGELHRRELVDDEGVKLAYKTMGYSAYWQDLLLELVKAVPTRVDVRRFWDMGTIDEARLREIYHAQGYYGKDLEDYVLWTKVYTAFPDLVARYKNGWITEEEVKSELVGFGMPEDRLQVLWETKFKKPISVERVVKERDLTKAEIYKGVKKGILTVNQGVEFLIAMGYDEFEAEYIIAINVEAGSSPETPLEFRKLIEAYKRSQGQVAKDIPEDVLALEREFQTVNRQLLEAKERGDSQEVLDRLEVAREDSMVRLRELLVLYEL